MPGGGTPALTRRRLLEAAASLAVVPMTAAPGRATGADGRAEAVLRDWYRLVLELVRHTPTYSPPVAARAFAYLGITALEALAAVMPGLRSLAGQVNGFPRGAAVSGVSRSDPAATLAAALARAVPLHFANTGPSGKRAMTAMEAHVTANANSGLPPTVAAASGDLGRAVAERIHVWSRDDGGAVVENMGFPFDWQSRNVPGAWEPTSTLGQQQAPLLPGWGQNRTFALGSGADCPVDPPPPYSESPGSVFHTEALELVAITAALTPEQKDIARFWSDDPMLSVTPPGHWASILLQIAERDRLPAGRLAEALALTGIAMSDALVACWHAKYLYDTVRPATYIPRVIDPAWTPLLITPPFPEYPSGHSVQSAAAAVVLDMLFGPDIVFEDATYVDDGLSPRTFRGFAAAAEEAAVSRVYGGVHFRAAVDRGSAQGRCVGAKVARLRTRA